MPDLDTLDDVTPAAVSPAGLPYPLPTDPIAGGADAIRSLALALDPRIFTVITAAKPNAAAPLTSWPVGGGSAGYTQAEASAAGWPGALTSMMVYTLRISGTVGIQIVYGRSVGGPPSAFYRISLDAATWTEWTNQAGAFGEAFGNFTFPAAAAGATVTATVTWPAGIFTRNPGAVITPLTSNPGDRFVGVSSVGVSSFIAAFKNGTAGSSTMAIYWHAFQRTSANSFQGFSALSSELTAVAQATLICATEGCENVDLPIVAPVQWVDDDGTAHDVDAVICGVCGLPIDNVVRIA